MGNNVNGEIENRPPEEWELDRVGLREIGIDRFRLGLVVAGALKRGEPLVRDALRLGRSLQLTPRDLLTRVG